MANDTLSEILQPHLEGRRTKTLVYLDEGLLDGNPNLPECIESYFRGRGRKAQSRNLACLHQRGRGSKKRLVSRRTDLGRLEPACDVSAFLSPS